MSQSGFLFFIYPLQDKDNPEEASYYGDEFLPYPHGAGEEFTTLDSYGSYIELADETIAEGISFEVPLDVWCNWKFNAKKFTITAGDQQVDGFYYGGVNTYTSGADETIYDNYPVPQYKEVEHGIIFSGRRQFQHKYHEYNEDTEEWDGPEHTVWRDVGSPPFGMFIHKGKSYFLIYKQFDSYQPITITSVSATKILYDEHNSDGDLIDSVSIDLLEPYYP